MNYSDENNHLTPFHEKGELNSEWCLWWRFQSGKSRMYDASQLQEVFTFKNMNTFSQIYNASVLGKISSFMNAEKKMTRGNSEKDIEFQNLPIDCLMLFRGSVRPEWEDPKNAKGGHFMVELTNPDADCSDELWKELSMCLVGEIWESSQYVNGLRILHKTKGDKKSYLKFEIWIEINKSESLHSKYFNNAEEQETAWRALEKQYHDIIVSKFKDFAEDLKWETHEKSDKPKTGGHGGHGGHGGGHGGHRGGGHQQQWGHGGQK